MSQMPPESLRASVVQLNSGDDIACNMHVIATLVGRAAAEGARLITLPENFAYLGGDDGRRAAAEEVLVGEAPQGPILGGLSELAARHNVWLLGGGMAERAGDEAPPFNTSVLLSPRGLLVEKYRKIHLFDVSLADGTAHKESAACGRGDRLVVADVDGAKVGLSICYDVRFPELYRGLVTAGAQIFTVPAAFTVTTGRDHWTTLLRARAIENQCFVLAPGQWGSHRLSNGTTRTTYGKSAIFDAWGDLLAQVGEGVGVATATLDFSRQAKVRAELPCLQHRAL